MADVKGPSIFAGYVEINKIVTKATTELETKFNSLNGLKGDQLTAAIAQANFELGRLNALTELSGNIGKSMNDVLNSMCKKV